MFRRGVHSLSKNNWKYNNSDFFLQRDTIWSFFPAMRSSCWDRNLQIYALFFIALSVEAIVVQTNAYIWRFESQHELLTAGKKLQIASRCRKTYEMLCFQLILDSGCMRPRKTLNIAQYFSATRGELTYFSCNEKLMLRRKHLNLWDILILCHRNAYPICFCCNNDRSEVFVLQWEARWQTTHSNILIILHSFRRDIHSAFKHQWRYNNPAYVPAVIFCTKRLKSEQTLSI